MFLRRYQQSIFHVQLTEKFFTVEIIVISKIYFWNGTEYFIDPSFIICPTRSVTSNTISKSQQSSLKGNKFKSFKAEQKIIDDTLSFLMSYSVKKKGPGRPSTKNIGSPNKTIPVTQEPNLRAFSNIGDLHPGTVLDLLNKINNFSWKVLDELYSLNEKYETLESKFPATKTSELVQQSEPKQSKREEELKLQVDNLEQQVNSNIVVLSGSVISDVMKTSQKKDINENIANVISENVFNISPKDIVNSTVLGKDKPILKVACSSENIKKRIISIAKKKRVPNLFVNEFLTQHRYKLFQQARSIKRNTLLAIYMFTLDLAIFIIN